MPATHHKIITLTLCLAITSSTFWAPSSSSRELPSSIAIYPARASHLHFDHTLHADAACATCHEGISSSTRTAQRHTPSMDTCVSCHGSSKESPAPALADCAACHVRYTPHIEATLSTPQQWRDVSPPPLITPRPQAELIFSHKAHAKSECTTCHDMSSDTSTRFPPKATCTTCHNAQPDAASDACDTCHTPKHVATFPAPTSTPSTHDAPAPPDLLVKGHSSSPPTSHQQGWMARHGIIALANADDCMTCHTEQSCGSCHNAQFGQPLTAHPPNYLVEHRLSARLAEQNCTDCHRQEASCLACHTESLAAPTGESSAGPPPAVAFHPSDWVDPGATNNHGVMARRNINECASCHQERDCISCHQGISPHPPEFAMSCGRIAKKNPLSCTKCHVDNLETLCPTL